MNNPLHNILRTQVSALYGDAFQEFCAELFIQRYGTQDFTRFRRTKDKGADGFLNSQKRVLACYGPESPYSYRTKSKFETKANSDFQSYQTHWQTAFPLWTMVVNHSIAPDQLKFLHALQATNTIWGLEHLHSVIISELPSANRRRILQHLQVPPEYHAIDLLSGILEDLLVEPNGAKHAPDYKLPTYIGEKFELNFAPAEIKSYQDEYDLLAEDFATIADVMQGFDADDLRKIKARIVCDFNMVAGTSFATKLNGLTTKYLDRYSSDTDDEHKHWIRALLYWMFTECLIGTKTHAG